MRKFTTGLALAAGIALSTVAPGVAASEPAPPPPPPNCSKTEPDKDNSKYAKLFRTNHVNVRSGPSTTCKALGQGVTSQKVDLHCTAGTWTYLRLSTGVEGWVNNGYLKDTSDVHC
ncbi:SH3 domain-containing protein [Saccharopolyspora sp. HNM0983]|uniref:SH3 domain-containing protein n=1 Tax=Saccharopolyspora montiporae TaxID=2781240 RepID=A0A929B5C1_9PSEU|nr:SH3 domain-containing protein [Saccharopolyspora sp. HNM0983]MBE9373444.1 SH3 domain-containing protein [Saccharopolyspora sp. HNM0983]